MEINKKLIEKLKKAQQALLDNKEIGARKLERMSAETKRAFDNAIESIVIKKNLFKELERRRKQLKRWRISIFKTIFPINIPYLLSAPFIYGMFIPAVFFHLCLEIYQQVCFRIYGIPRVRAREFFVYDRHLLPYLNWLEKINCFYCSYFNNLLRFGTEIGARTERYWCPIKYARRVENTHSQYDKFVGYLDAESFRGKWEDLRNFSDIELEQKALDQKMEVKAQDEKDKQCDFSK